MRLSVLVAVLVLVTARNAYAQFDPDFPPADGPGKRPPPEEPKPPAEDSRGDAPSNAPHLALGAGMHLGLGIAPSLATGFQGSVEMANYRWSVGLEGRYDLPSTGDTATNARARTWLAGGSLVPCLRAQALWACGVVMVSHVSSSGEGVHDSWLVLGLGARLAFHFPIKRNFAIRIVGEALMHPLPWSLQDGDRVIYKSSVVSTTLGPALVHAW